MLPCCTFSFEPSHNEAEGITVYLTGIFLEWGGFSMLFNLLAWIRPYFLISLALAEPQICLFFRSIISIHITFIYCNIYFVKYKPAVINGIIRIFFGLSISIETHQCSCSSIFLLICMFWQGNLSLQS